jgi:hypothetical protein
MIGRLRPAGHFVRCSSNLAICRPHRLEAGSGSAIAQGYVMYNATASNQNSIHPTKISTGFTAPVARKDSLIALDSPATSVQALARACKLFTPVICAMKYIRMPDTDSEPEAAPSIGKSDSVNLYCLSQAAATLLRDVSEEYIAQLNRFWDE